MTKNELQILAESFYHLLDTTNRQFQMLAEKADLEQRLKDEQLCRVTMESQLHRARLQMFQSLVNPHFLFNTLSVGADLADEEDAPRTQEFIEHLSVFLRYSLTYLNKTVTISQEAQNLRLYFYMQQLRFKERFRFLVEIDPDCERVVLPAMNSSAAGGKCAAAWRGKLWQRRRCGMPGQPQGEADLPVHGRQRDRNDAGKDCSGKASYSGRHGQ